VWISHATARSVHIQSSTGSAPVRIGVGTVDTVAPGVVTMDLKLAHAVTQKLERLHRLSVTVRLTLIDSSGDHVVIDAAGRY
jgi:hypothetical protein